MQPERTHRHALTPADTVNVVRLPVPFRPTTPEGRQAAHIRAFADHRRDRADVYWLKEVAECLGTLKACGAAPGRDALAPLADYYDALAAHCAFYPQYYRFHLGIALDLEALGMPGRTGADIARYVLDEGLADHELSDLQRGEAGRLLERAGLHLPGQDQIAERLRAFAGRARHFAVPNKKAAYELTHIVFYLSEYGQRDPGLGAETERSLNHVGILAFLEQNADLLAEVAVALHYMNAPVPAAWRDWLAGAWADCAVLPGTAPQDSYHQYIVLGWAASVLQGGPVFDRPIPEGAVNFHIATEGHPTLRDLSQRLAGLGPERNADWSRMRQRVMGGLTDTARSIIEAAEAATPCFETFFEGFSRSRQIVPPPGLEPA